MKRIVLTGGGTAGHVTPNLALVPSLKDAGYEIFYIGSYDGIEKKLASTEGLPYYGISSGKLRRYFDVKNFSDPFRVMKGYMEARKLIKKINPDIIFSKGGFVSVPVVTAGSRCGVPVIVHESDMTPGLANKLAFPSASRICCSFRETVDLLPKDKAVFTGSPIRKEILTGSKEKALKFTGFESGKPVILVVGGSLGAAAINEGIRKILPKLLSEFQIIHICGRGKVDPTMANMGGYIQYEYISQELPDLFSLADIIVSRAGSNSICEFLALKKPNLLIPLPAASSRGDQILNARSFEKQNFSMVMKEEDMNDASLYEAIHTLYERRSDYRHTMDLAGEANAVKTIVELIQKYTK